MSPRRELVNDFQKPPVPKVFYMPLWTREELEKISRCFPNSTGWMERFDILGGFPRKVLEDTTKDPTKLLEDACKVCSFDDCIKIIGLNSTITEKVNVVHSLIHVTSSSPYTECSVLYASETAVDLIVRNKGAEVKRKMVDFLQSSDGNPLTAALCGYIFEAVVLDLLEKGGSFDYHQLVHGNTRNQPKEKKLLIPPSQKKVVEKIESNQSHSRLHVPKSRNYPGVDAWIPGIGAFQITIGKKHDIKGDVKEALSMLGRDANKLYWLLPSSNYQNFKMQSPHDIDQYAVRIPYPNYL